MRAYVRGTDFEQSTPDEMVNFLISSYSLQRLLVVICLLFHFLLSPLPTPILSCATLLFVLERLLSSFFASCVYFRTSE